MSTVYASSCCEGVDTPVETIAIWFISANINKSADVDVLRSVDAAACGYTIHSKIGE